MLLPFLSIIFHYAHIYVYMYTYTHIYIHICICMCILSSVKYGVTGASVLFSISFFFKDFIYLFMRHREREAEKHRQREKQAPCRDPDVGLDSRSPGSHPGLKGPLNH